MRTLTDLAFIAAEPWLPGDPPLQWRAVPFPYKNPPWIPSRVPWELYTVEIAGLLATQRRVTERGILKYADGEHDPPFLIEGLDGRLYILDGHHRLTAAWLRGDTTAEVRIAKEPS